MANIDDELAYLKQVGEFDGPMSREAIANALSIIINDRAYSPRVLRVTRNGEYETPEDEPYTQVIVDVDIDEPTGFYVGYAPVLQITANGTYISKEIYGENYIINEIEVNVPTNLTTQVPLEVTQNGEYILSSDMSYSQVTVNIPGAAKAGDVLSAEFYFRSPNDPNFASKQFIAKEDGILFGKSALGFISRFPQLQPITYYDDTEFEKEYRHIGWNPDPSAIKCDNQPFESVWQKGFISSEYYDDYIKVDLDIFLYIVNHKSSELFFRSTNVIQLFDQNTGDFLCNIYYVGKGITDVDGNTSNACYYIKANISIPYCDTTDISDINASDVFDGDKYYWWGCSYIRAFLNKDRSMLKRQDDIDRYDNDVSRGYTIDSMIPQELYDVIKPVSHSVRYAKRVDTNYKYYSKSVPRDILTYRRTNTLRIVDHADIPIDPDTQQQSPKYGGLSEALYDREGNFVGFQLTEDVTVVSGKNYYGTSDGYKISVTHPKITDKRPEYDTYHSTGWSNYELNMKHNSVLYISSDTSGNYTAYKNVNGEMVEYTYQEHLDYLYVHYWGSKNYYMQSIWALTDKIQELEGVPWSASLIDPSRVYVIYYGEYYKHYYFYRNDYPITIYEFEGDIDDESEAASKIHRYCELNDPNNKVQEIMQHINQNDYVLPIYHTGEKLTEYEPFGDQWPGDYYNHYPDSESELVNCWYSGSLLPVKDYKFFNYYEIKDGMATCPDAYYFDRYYNQTTGKYEYKIFKEQTEYTGYQSTMVNYQAANDSETVTDKFIVDPTDPGLTKNITSFSGEFNNIYVGLIEDIEAVYNVEHNIMNNIQDIFANGIDYAHPHHTYLYDEKTYGYTSDRNINRYIYADNKTAAWFEHEDEMNFFRPDIHFLPTYEDTQTKWQEFYDEFELYDHLVSPYRVFGSTDWYTRTFQNLYFYL